MQIFIPHNISSIQEMAKKMTIKYCKDCKKQICNQTKNCSHCGAKSKAAPIAKIATILVAVFFILIFTGFLFSVKTPEYEKQALSQRNTCLEIAKQLEQPSLSITCHENFTSAIIKGQMSSENYQSTTKLQQTKEEEKEKLIQDYKSDCLLKKESIVSSIIQKKYDEITYLERNKIERCAHLTKEPDFINLLEKITEISK
jgi:hypothetical protein